MSFLRLPVFALLLSLLSISSGYADTKGTTLESVAVQAPQQIDSSAARSGVKVDAELAFRALENSEKAFSDLVENLNITITFGGALIAIVGLVGLVLIGRQGDKHKTELEAKITAHEKMNETRREEFETKRKEFETRLTESYGQLSTDVKERLEALHSMLPEEIERIALASSGRTDGYLKKLKTSTESLEKEMERYKKLLSTAERLVEDVSSENADPYLDYVFVDSLGKPSNADEKTAQSRFEAIFRLKRIVRQGLQGRVDSNLLFNAGVAASRAELDDEALQLATLASLSAPLANHQLLMYRLQMALGRRYDVTKADDGKLKLEICSGSDGESESIISNAFANALESASDAPLPQCEITYAELWNMAQKVRELGGYERMRDTLEASLRARLGNSITKEEFSHQADRERFSQTIWDGQKGKQVPSYLAGILALSYAAIGTGNWLEKYREYTELGAKLAAKESPLTTWRGKFLESGLKWAKGIGLGDEVKNVFQQYKLQVPTGLDGESQGQDPGELLRFIERLQAAREIEEKAPAPR
jgi:hypothetical protein